VPWVVQYNIQERVPSKMAENVQAAIWAVVAMDASADGYVGNEDEGEGGNDGKNGNDGLDRLEGEGEEFAISLSLVRPARLAMTKGVALTKTRSC
jgi:hypothetical protein